MLGADVLALVGDRLEKLNIHLQGELLSRRSIWVSVVILVGIGLSRMIFKGQDVLVKARCSVITNIFSSCKVFAAKQLVTSYSYGH